MRKVLKKNKKTWGGASVSPSKFCPRLVPNGEKERSWEIKLGCLQAVRIPWPSLFALGRLIRLVRSTSPLQK